MRGFFSAASLLIPACLGASLLSALWPREGPQGRMLRVALSIPIGSGVCSILLLAWLVILGRPGRGALAIEMAAALLLAWRGLRARGGRGEYAVRPRLPCVLIAGAGAVFLLVAA